MARILKRPMFNRGGSSNQGIMDGLVDRTGLAEGTPKFDTGKMKEDASSILSKISKFTPGGIIGRGIASMTKGNEAEIVKAIQKMLAVTPVGQVGEAIRILANRYRIDPAVVERIAKSQMTDANIQTDPSGSADEGFPSRPEFESSAEDTSVMPRTNRFDKFKGSISDKELNEFYDRDELDKLYENIKPVPMPGFEKPPLSPDATTLNPHQDINPMQTMEFRDSNGNGIEDRSEGIYLDRDIIPYDPDREFKSLKNSDMFKKYRDNIEFNQGGRVGFNEGTPSPFDDKRTAADVEAITNAMNKYAPVPETRLPLGELGAGLMSGRGFKDSAVDAYGSFVTRDDKRRAAMAGRTSSAVSTSLGQQIAERNAKLKQNQSNMQKEFSNRRNYNELYKKYTDPKLAQGFKKVVAQIFPDAMAEYGSSILDNKEQIQQTLKAPLLGVVPNKVSGSKVDFKFEDMVSGGIYFAPDDKLFYQRVIEDNKNFLISYDTYTLKEVNKIELQ